MSTVNSKLKQLRLLMKQVGVDAYYVPSTDPHQSEYVPPCWQRRRWLSEFTGSAGDLVITATTAGLWTDGRYFLQAGRQLKGSGIKLHKLGNPGVATIPAWLSRTLKPGQVLGADPRVLTLAGQDELAGVARGAGAKLKLVDRNLVDALWGRERPAPSAAPIDALPTRFAGESVASKLRRLRKEMKAARADAHVLSSLDAIAWLFNIRSTDVDHNPVAIAYAIVTQDAAMLFTNPAKVSPATARGLVRVQIRPYKDVAAALAKLGQDRARVWVDGKTVNVWITRKLRNASLVTRSSPVTRMKARKNATEIAGMRAAHVRDGVAMARFFAWLQRTVRKGQLTELTVGQRLIELRSKGQHYRGTSFPTIAGYLGHGAVIHYEASADSASTLKPEGILLVDSGAQYLDGTTDITRTVLLGGKATPEQKDRFTRVLAGHIDLARTRFPAGTVGKQLDTIARTHLWAAGINYNHGTGHGVGFYLNVHEGPQSISPTRCTGVPLELGNIQSNEPGYYKEGEYGIRTENLVLVVPDREAPAGDVPFMRFETLTLCPIDRRLVDKKLLNKEQRLWLNEYHARVRKALKAKLDQQDRGWLEQATKAI